MVFLKSQEEAGPVSKTSAICEAEKSSKCPHFFLPIQNPKLTQDLKHFFCAPLVLWCVSDDTKSLLIAREREHALLLLFDIMVVSLHRTPTPTPTPTRGRRSSSCSSSSSVAKTTRRARSVVLVRWGLESSTNQSIQSIRVLEGF